MAGRLRRRARQARGAITEWMHRVWAVDRTAVRGWRALRCRLLRLLTWTVAGFVRHKLSLRAVALTYYTMFSIIPLLAVVVWVANAFDWIPHIGYDPAQPAVRPLLRDNAQLASALASIERAVRRVDLTGGGLVGAVALLYAIARLFRHIEGTVDTIAGATKRPLQIRRLAGYAVLLVMPAALAACAGVISTFLLAPLRGVVSHAVGGLATIQMVLGVVIAAGAIALMLAILYGAAARARVPLASAVLGGLVGACLLLVTMWAFVALQIGVSRRDGVTSGVAAIPVLFLLTYTSWLMVLIGAEIAVGHAVERIVPRGVAVLIPDAAASQIIGALVVAEVVRATQANAPGPPAADTMAGKLRVLPQAVRAVADRLVRSGLLAGGADGYTLRGDPDELRLSDVCDALARDGGRADGRAALLAELSPEAQASLAAVAGVRAVTSGDMTLRQLAGGGAPDAHQSRADLCSGQQAPV